jgi:hypothetical protein
MMADATVVFVQKKRVFVETVKIFHQVYMDKLHVLNLLE